MVYLFASIAFFLWLIRSLLFWTSLWQLKEYRRDRFFTFIRETTQGRRIVFSGFNGIYFLLFFSYPYFVLNDKFLTYYQYAVVVFLFAQATVFIKEIIEGRFKRPIVTAKSVIICAVALTAGSLLYTVPLIDQYAWFLWIELGTPFVIAITIFFLSFPTELYTDMLMQRVADKLKKHRKLLVIGVSGSYGKSSTIANTAHILSKKFTVAKTPLFNNTKIAIAKSILKHVNKTTDVLLVEMNAYRKGDIAEMAKAVRPDIGIITSVSDQHLSLFKKVEKLCDSQYELINALPKSGFVLFNGNSEGITPLLDKTKKRKIMYGSHNGKKKFTLTASGIKATKDELVFWVTYRNKRKQYKAPLLGEYHVENILPAIFIAKSLGMPDKEIQQAVATLRPLSKTMRKLVLQNGLTVVDDTATSSPEAVIAAAKYMESYRRKRIFVLTPLIELGSKAKKRHYEIGKSLSHATHVFLTNTNYANAIKEGLKDVKAKTEVHVLKSSQVAERIIDVAGREDIVIFEGKEAASILNQIV